MPESPTKVTLNDCFEHFHDHWNPRIIAELNGQHVKIARIKGEFVWHHHENEDEMFLVIKGSFRMEFRDRHVSLDQGDMIVVPRGVEHRPVADEEAQILLFEPASTINTGSAGGQRTRSDLERL